MSVLPETSSSSSGARVCINKYGKEPGVVCVLKVAIGIGGGVGSHCEGHAKGGFMHVMV